MFSIVVHLVFEYFGIRSPTFHSLHSILKSSGYNVELLSSIKLLSCDIKTIIRIFIHAVNLNLQGMSSGSQVLHQRLFSGGLFDFIFLVVNPVVNPVVNAVVS